MVATRRSDRREKKKRHVPPPPSYSDDVVKDLGVLNGGGDSIGIGNLTARTPSSNERGTRHQHEALERNKDQHGGISVGQDLGLSTMMTPTTSTTESDVSSTTTPVPVTPPVSEHKQKKPKAVVAGAKAKVIRKVTLRKSSRRTATNQTINKSKGTAGSVGTTTAKSTTKRRVNTRSAARSAGPEAVELLPGIEDEAQLFKNNSSSNSKPSKNKKKKKNKREDPNVTKIQMLTGVLYIYKGSNIPRRVEFVRTR